MKCVKALSSVSMMDMRFRQGCASELADLLEDPAVHSSQRLKKTKTSIPEAFPHPRSARSNQLNGKEEYRGEKTYFDTVVVRTTHKLVQSLMVLSQAFGVLRYDHAGEDATLVRTPAGGLLEGAVPALGRYVRTFNNLRYGEGLLPGRGRSLNWRRDPCRAA